MPRAAHAATHPFTDIPVGGTSAAGNVFSGTMTILSFIPDIDNGVEAIGMLTGTIKPPRGPVTSVTNVIVLVPLVIPVANFTARLHPLAAAPACQILNLILQPLDLNLLGLTVHLNTVVLNIAAQPGPGNLLGNLLCAITNLLNGPDLGNVGANLFEALAALPNQLIGLV